MDVSVSECTDSSADPDADYYVTEANTEYDLTVAVSHGAAGSGGALSSVWWRPSDVRFPPDRSRSSTTRC